MIIEGRISYPKNFPEGARDLLSLMLVSNPEDRISISEVKVHWWIIGL
jgi:hypothetical protein